jgi:peptide/nickel transport system substrate-binding protein
MRIDITPTSDVRVRRALTLATDFESIKQSVNKGQGEIITFPTMPNKGYAALYIGLNDPDMPADVKELFSYKPEKAKQLLKDAGYPNGFKVSVLATSAAADYLSIYKDMWSKVGVDLDIMIREPGVITTLVSSGQNPPLTVGIVSSPGRFYQSEVLTGEGVQNLANIRKDPTIEAAMSKIRTLALTDMQGAEGLFRTLVRDYVLGQAFAIPTPMAQHSVFWWPWIKEYSGETILPIGVYNRWSEWIWLDQNLKKSMGY